MYLNNYSVVVTPFVGDPNTPEGSAGYVSIAHGQKYKLRLRNSNNTRCDAEVFVDNKHVGTWRIDGRNTITIERPADDTGHFTAYLTDSHDGRQAGLDTGRTENGLIQVIFRPERKPQFNPRQGEKGVIQASLSSERGLSFASTSEMGTGLSGHSGQQFGTAAHIDYEPGAEVTISLRLIGADESPRPLSPSHRGNPVPPPVR